MAKLYFVDAEKTDEPGKQYTYDGKFQNQSVIKSMAKENGYRIRKIVSQKNHHRCSYCGDIIDGENKEELCMDCR